MLFLVLLGLGTGRLSEKRCEVVVSVLQEVESTVPYILLNTWTVLL